MSVKIRVYNDSSEDLTVGLFGENPQLTFRVTVPAGGRHTQTFLTGGDRVLIAWDEFTDEFFPNSGQAVATQSLADGAKIKARIDDSGWAFALPAPGQPFDTNNFG